ncbi:MAG: tripartite tricarboxylate transporter substrate binding protein [Deltaproteobacteria bacterium]|nr:tripartite tricarboxylate transporter substrate binding protein [Deltaproteobacteria bacterium]
MRKRFRILALGVLTGFLTLGLSFHPALGAAKYPSKPIEMVVGYGAGSVTDIVARALANSARKYIDQPVVVMNKAGGGGQVGNEYVINAKPDGYTVIFGYGSGETIIAPHMLKLAHNPVEAMKTVILVTESPMVIAVKGDSPFKKVKDVIEYAKQNPGKVSFGASPGGITYTTPELLAMKGGVKFTFVPTTGTGATLTNVMGGHVSMGSLTPSVAAGPMKSGKIRVLAIASETRNKVLPDVPTFREEGYDIVMAAIKGIAVPKETPEEVIRYLHDAFKKVIEDPEFVGLMDKLGEPITYKDSKDFEIYIQKMYKVCGEIIEALGQKAK